MTPTHLPGRVAIPALPEQPRTPSPTALHAFNTAAEDDAHRFLASCLNSTRWTHRVAAHRPYPDLDALLAAADEAAYDLSPTDLTQALAAETLPALPTDMYEAAHLALGAAHAAYETRFGHAFVISLATVTPDECLNHVLTTIHTRLSHDPEKERAVAADQLRRLARDRLTTHLRAASK
ncbi:2-oxo-4-hydroxy-4-carboxy-5-ureidoimidazoline decarboxylase [Streptomyces sp. NPDC087294]|uniref:2-oxo-4-hydroxy-4-carboxy-5-ureidoimidazoline decarboxylase n=1 Tax=Streptomyces sp. NPDC087294 TaxID=3365777 RepID=UPI0038281559